MRFDRIVIYSLITLLQAAPSFQYPALGTLPQDITDPVNLIEDTNEQQVEDRSHDEEFLVGFDAVENEKLSVFLSTYYREHTTQQSLDHAAGDLDGNGLQNQEERLAKLELMVRNFDENHELTSIIYHEQIFNVSSLSLTPSETKESGQLFSWFGASCNQGGQGAFVEAEPVSVVNKIYDYKENQLINVRFLDYLLFNFAVSVRLPTDSVLDVLIDYQDTPIILTNNLQPENADTPRRWNRFLNDSEAFIILTLTLVFLVILSICGYCLILFNSGCKRMKLRKGPMAHSGTRLSAISDREVGAEALDEKQRLIKTFFSQHK